MSNEESKIKALISLLDDEDAEVSVHVKQEIMSIGESIIPFLEDEWGKNFNPLVQKRIEDIIHQLHFGSLKDKLRHWKISGATDLVEGMWLLASYQYPDLELEKVKSTLEQLYFEVWPEMKEDLSPVDQVKILNGVIFGKLKFGANTKNFHSPSNSMINSVLESKKGNPISLCVIYMHIAQRLNLPIYGVNLPNLFILTYKTKDVQFYINAFNKGLVFTREDIDNYITQLNIAKNDIFYEPCTNVDIITRVLRNLVVSFEKLGDTERVDEINELLEVIV
ncbi:MAG TPA: transglutaminase-like domain-containing protein [Cytophagaceae bacterium]|jgi:regulator of sirC expression with transglutaminase-like and TPR domain|nr:transglutaminase-like domain-containing protein [Cytophagaceae bacterium]